MIGGFCCWVWDSDSETAAVVRGSSFVLLFWWRSFVMIAVAWLRRRWLLWVSGDTK